MVTATGGGGEETRFRGNMPDSRGGEGAAGAVTTTPQPHFLARFWRGGEEKLRMKNTAAVAFFAVSLQRTHKALESIEMVRKKKKTRNVTRVAGGLHSCW